MVILRLVDQVFKMTPKPIDWIYTHVLFMTAKFKSVASYCDLLRLPANYEGLNQLKGHLEER